MRSLHDHEIKFMADAAMYLNLKHAAEADDRSVGSLIRHIVHEHFQRQAIALAALDATTRPDHGQNRANTDPD